MPHDLGNLPTKKTEGNFSKAPIRFMKSNSIKGAIYAPLTLSNLPTTKTVEKFFPKYG